MTTTAWQINDLEYFETPGLSALVFHNIYPEGKQGGLEIIQHGERVATNGDLRLEIAPGQWASLPKVKQCEVDKNNETINVSLTYSDLSLNYTVRVCADGNALRLVVDLAQPLPAEWVGKVSFNLELFPGVYFGKTFSLGDTFGLFPRQANGPMMPGMDDELEPVPLATGARLVVAPEDPLRRMVIESPGGEVSLFDGRDMAQNGWFVVRSVVPTGATKNAVEWIITPNAVPDWRRDPVICISQVGYHPHQVKQAIIELDPRLEPEGDASLLRIEPDGEMHQVLSAPVEAWGQFLRYKYGIFDFTSVQEPGMYVVRYQEQTTPPIKISQDVYQKDVWQPTLETFFPVQMCHVEVRDRYRVWHGACHLDDALQAPPNHDHFDGYRQGPKTEIVYAPYAHIPGLNRGGWHDAGDYDLAAGSQAWTTLFLALIRGTFGVDVDQTTVRQAEHLVVLHTPDGVPDIVQQVAHGVENLLTGYRVAGHSFSGIIAGTVEQYVHLGDACTMTDNLVYDPELEPDAVTEGRSGKRDDRWAFTNHDTSLEYLLTTALAAASRVLRGYEDELADECLETALNTWQTEQANEPVGQHSAYIPGHPAMMEVLAAIELLITTGADSYRQRLLALWPTIQENLPRLGGDVARALPYIKDNAFTAKLRLSLQEYQATLAAELSKNPFGIPHQEYIWGIGWLLQRYAVQQYYLIQAFPDLFERENVLRVVNYVLGCHPASNISLVSGVGARSETIAYGVNRADWSYIPGGNFSGVALIKPDFPELKESFPFIWQQTEYVISGAATYIFCVLAADKLLNA